MFPCNPIDWQGSPHDWTGDNQLGIYINDDTQRYVPGTRLTTWDGRVFKYSGSKGALLAGFGAMNNSAAVNISVTAATIAAGDRTIDLAFGAADGYAGDGVLAEKELVGGYYVTGHAVSTVQNRCIIDTDGVSASGVGATITLYLDGPISNALTTPFTEVVLNPYRYLNKGILEYQAVMGVPAANRTSTYWGWIQTWGPCWVTPGGADAVPGNSANDRSVVFVGDGSVNGVTAITLKNGYQVAGFIIDETANGTGALPLVMLQISV